MTIAGDPLSRPDATFFSDEEAGSLIINNTQDSYILISPQFTIVYCNRIAKETIRTFLDIDIFPGFNILNAVPDDRVPALTQRYEAVLRGGTFTNSHKFVSKEGQPIYFESYYHPAYNTEGQITGIIVTSKDISEKKIAQQAVQESEERLQFALEAAAQGVWDWNLVTDEVIYSESYKKLYGFKDNELKNHVSEWITRIHPDDKQKMQDSVAEHISSNHHVYDSQYRIRDNEGRYRWVLAKGRLVSFDEKGKPVRMIGTHTDITDAVENELELKRMNERFDSMMKATHELLWEWDVISNLVYRTKDGIRNVFGITEDDSLKTIDTWMSRLHPEDQSRIAAVLKNILQAQHQQTFEVEYRFLRDDGEYAYVYDRGILIRDEQNRAVRVIGAAQNISERKRLEKVLLQAELDYQRLIHQATVDSQEKERSEIGKELHDNINQVLTTTKLYLDLALTNSDLKEELIRKSLLNINNVIQEIRHLSRSLMDPSIGDLGLIDSIKDLVENIHLTQKLNIHFTADEKTELLIDETQKLTVFRIIQETLNNVLRHAKATVVAVSLSVEEDTITLVIQDDGIGFFPETIKKGAGLKNIQNRVYLINGTLRLQSTPGEGCTVQIQFPVKK